MKFKLWTTVGTLLFSFSFVGCNSEPQVNAAEQRPKRTIVKKKAEPPAETPENRDNSQDSGDSRDSIDSTDSGDSRDSRGRSQKTSDSRSKRRSVRSRDSKDSSSKAKKAKRRKKLGDSLLHSELHFSKERKPLTLWGPFYSSSEGEAPSRSDLKRSEVKIQLKPLHRPVSPKPDYETYKDDDLAEMVALNDLAGKWQIKRIESQKKKVDLSFFEELLDHGDRLTLAISKSKKGYFEFQRRDERGKTACTLRVPLQFDYCCPMMRRLFVESSKKKLQEKPSGCVRELLGVHADEFAEQVF